jgi:hypothetical protein
MQHYYSFLQLGHCFVELDSIDFPMARLLFGGSSPGVFLTAPILHEIQYETCNSLQINKVRIANLRIWGIWFLGFSQH